MEVEYIKGLGHPVNIIWGNEATAITVTDAKQLQAKLAQVIEQAEKEPELTEFEKALEMFLMNADASEQTFYGDVKKYAGELLDLARKEIMGEWSKGLRDTQDRPGKAYNDGYNLGYERGKTEALEDLPRWRKANITCFVGDALIKDCYGYYFSATAKEGSIYILKSDLEKLPGFNE